MYGILIKLNHRFFSNLLVLVLLTAMVLILPPDSKADQITVDTASLLLLNGTQGYKKVYGEWPDSWSAVVSAGIVQVDLNTVDGQSLNPDDGSFDFIGDKQFLPATENAGPRIVTLLDIDGQHLDYLQIPDCMTYEELIGTLPNQDKYVGVLENEARLIQFAIAGCCLMGLNTYSWQHGGPPQDWSEFINSPFSPINQESVNPLTETRFYGDGRPDDYAFVYYREAGVAAIVPIGSDESTFWHFAF